MKSSSNCFYIILTMILFCITLYLTLSFGVPRMALKEKYPQDLILSSNPTISTIFALILCDSAGGGDRRISHK